MKKKEIKKGTKGKRTEQKPSPPWSWPKWLGWALAVIVLVVWAVVNAKPVMDGDLFFHLAYAKYMVTHHTLILDHTIYSWTPTDNSLIYCNWIAEFIFYFLYKLGGLFPIFGLVYLFMAVFILISFYFAYKLGLTRHPLTWLAILTGLLSSEGASLQKPEIFSYVFMCLSAGVWFGIKVKPEQRRLCYAFPLIMLIWVNSHGGFIFGFFFFFLIGLGEGLNFIFALPCALPKKTLYHLGVSFMLAVLAMMATPYGIAYPLQVVGSIFKGDELLRMVQAFASIFEAKTMHYVDYFFIMGSLLLVLIWMSRTLDLSLMVANFALGLLFLRFLRTTYFWMPVAVLSIIYFLSRTERLRVTSRGFGLVITGIAGCLSLFLAGRAYFETVCYPYTNLWCGFGIGYQNPVMETEFLKKFHPGKQLGNTYGVGGYLIWALWPDYKVMIDPRYFPYRNWHEEYWEFHAGKNFNQFLKRFPCDVFVIDYPNQVLLNHFIMSPDWQCAFYGPSAAVFIKKGVALPLEAREFGKERFKDIKNFANALDIFVFAINASDFPMASQILEAMKRRFTWRDKKSQVKQCEIYYEGTLSVFSGEYEKAIAALESSREIITNDFLMVKLRNWETRRLAREGKYQAALEQARLALSLDPVNLYALFNVGSLGYWLQKNQPEEKNPARPENLLMLTKGTGDGRANLQKFLKLYGSRPDVPKQILEYAREVLEGNYQGKPIVISPSRPKKEGENGK